MMVTLMHHRRIVLHQRVIESYRKENERAKENPRHQGVTMTFFFKNVNKKNITNRRLLPLFYESVV